VVLFSYLNPILRYGLTRFLKDAAELGIAGLLLTDLPAGSDPEVEGEVQKSPLDLIRLVAPTTRPERVTEAVRAAQGFVYVIARLGVTGATPQLAADLADTIARVRAATTLPIAAGFGISTPAQAVTVGKLADGVVVGSALVDVLGREGVGAAEAYLVQLRAALDSIRLEGAKT
jgi:tryptophan synthase alpha chain